MPGSTRSRRPQNASFAQSGGSRTTERRERQTLDLLLVTLLTPSQMFWGKLISGWRVSSVLTSFLLWPVILACFMMYWRNLPTMAGYLLIVGLCSITTAMTALFCSTVAHKTSTSLLATYSIIVILFTAPLAASYFAGTFYSNSPNAERISQLGAVSPFAATFALPLDMRGSGDTEGATNVITGNVPLFFSYFGVTLLYNVALLLLIMWMFRMRWRVSE